jgi:hypothetical protein
MLFPVYYYYRNNEDQYEYNADYNYSCIHFLVVLIVIYQI